MKRIFKITDDQLTVIKEACSPLPHIMIGGAFPRSPQERANSAWMSLGRELGFDGMTVEPVDADDPNTFTAESTE